MSVDTHRSQKLPPLLFGVSPVKISQMSDSENVVCLHALEGQAYGSGSGDIPIWGKPVIFNSRQDALDWLNPEKDEIDLQFVRLVLVADYHLLKRMCVPALEGVQSTEAGLYIEVSPTCPAFYALWDETTADTAHEVCSNLRRSWTRDALVKTFQDGAGGIVAPLKLQLCKAIQSSSGGGAMVKVNPGVTVVRRGWCHEDDFDDHEGLGGAKAQEEVAEDNASTAE